MNERIGPSNQEAKTRLRIIEMFRYNFRRFLDEEMPKIKLISIFFVPEMDEPTISSFDGETQTHIKYNGIDKELEKVIEKYRKSGNEPMYIPAETYKLAEFEGMSDRLKTFIGKDIKVLSTMYELVSMPNARAMVSKDTYYSPKDAHFWEPIEEIWIAERSEQKIDSVSKSDKSGSTLRRPIIKPKVHVSIER